MTHIMVDLETLSTRTNATILAIGAVKFDTERKVYHRFYEAVQTPTGIPGFHISGDTMDWWAQQSEEARKVFVDPNAVPIDVALTEFASWATSDCNKKDIRIWGNGAAFDNAILSTAYTLCEIEQPWNFWNDRCYRTMKHLVPGPALIRSGTHHNAVDDAESQALHLLAMEIELA